MEMTPVAETCEGEVWKRDTRFARMQCCKVSVLLFSLCSFSSRKPKADASQTSPKTPCMSQIRPNSVSVLVPMSGVSVDFAPSFRVGPPHTDLHAESFMT